MIVVIGVNRFPVNLDFESGTASYASRQDIASSVYYDGDLPIGERFEGTVVLDNLDSHTYSSVIDDVDCNHGRGKKGAAKCYYHMLQPSPETFNELRSSAQEIVLP